MSCMIINFDSMTPSVRVFYTVQLLILTAGCYSPSLRLTHFRIKWGRAWGKGCKKRPHTSFSHVTSTKVGLSPQNFLTFSFNSFAALV